VCVCVCVARHARCALRVVCMMSRVQISRATKSELASAEQRLSAAQAVVTARVSSLSKEQQLYLSLLEPCLKGEVFSYSYTVRDEVTLACVC
jgi:hypothetical protein